MGINRVEHSRVKRATISRRRERRERRKRIRNVQRAFVEMIIARFDDVTRRGYQGVREPAL